MNIVKSKPAACRKTTIYRVVVISAAFYIQANDAHAHLGYGGRDFGSFSGLSNAVASITNQTVTGNYGWADAADGILGDSHRGRAFRFRLENAGFVSVTVSANPNATTNSIGGLIPAFSIYSGLGAVAPFAPTQTSLPSAADHDGSEASLAWRTWWVQQNIDPEASNSDATDGCWNALGDWKIGGDGDLPGDFPQLSSLIYKGSAAATAGSRVTGSFALAAGEYTLFIGGNDIANKTADTALSPHGIAATMTVAATPILSIVPKVFVPMPTGVGSNWILQTSASVDGPNWSAVTTTRVNVDGQDGAILDAGAVQQYYRFSLVP